MKQLHSLSNCTSSNTCCIISNSSEIIYNTKIPSSDGRQLSLNTFWIRKRRIWCRFLLKDEKFPFSICTTSGICKISYANTIIKFTKPKKLHKVLNPEVLNPINKEKPEASICGHVKLIISNKNNWTCIKARNWLSYLTHYLRKCCWTSRLHQIRQSSYHFNDIQITFIRIICKWNNELSIKWYVDQKCH